MGEAKEHYPFKCRAPLKIFLNPQIQNPKPHTLNPPLNHKMLKP